MPRPGERLGVLGGTFDPPHVGHLAAAVGARHDLALDRVLMVVANRPWQKVGARAVTPVEDRLAMAGLLVEGVAGVEVSTTEIDRGGDSYTVDTLVELADADPTGTRFLVVGADAAGGIDTWRRADELPALAVLALIERPGYEVEVPGPPWRTEVVHIPGLEVSSEHLRDRVAAGRPIDGLTVPEVVSFVAEHRLYGGRP